MSHETKRQAFWVAGGVALSLLFGCGAPDRSQEQQREPTLLLKSWKLPRALREISGLAYTSRGEMLAVADEQAVVYVLNPETGKTSSVFSLGNPPLAGDFEGIALLDDWVYLVTSTGVLLRTRGAPDGQSAAFERFDLPTDCEVEGLTEDPALPRLWIACKGTLGGTTKSQIRLYAWDAGSHRLLADETLELAEGDLAKRTAKKRFKPSGIVFQQRSSEPGYDLLLIAGAQSIWARYSWGPVPQLLAAGRLPKAHRQAEGIEIDTDGNFWIADEGGEKRGRLRAYSPSLFE